MTAARCRLIFIVICTLVAAVLFWQTFLLPAPQFEPVGGARVPQVAAMLIMVLCVAASIIGLRNPADADDSTKRASVGRGATFVLLFIAYSLALSLRLVGFAWLTAAFLIALHRIYGSPGKHRRITYGALILSAFALEYIFTQIFIIDLATSY